jgi:hypothetical protein
MFGGKEYVRLQTRLETVRAAIKVVLRHVESLPPSDGKQQLRALVQDCLRDADVWESTAPGPLEREELMKRLLALHIAVTKMEGHGQVVAPAS